MVVLNKWKEQPTIASNFKLEKDTERLLAFLKDAFQDYRITEVMRMVDETSRVLKKRLDGAQKRAAEDIEGWSVKRF